jgi:hypothetical protein
MVDQDMLERAAGGGDGGAEPKAIAGAERKKGPTGEATLELGAEKRRAKPGSKAASEDRAKSKGGARVKGKGKTKGGATRKDRKTPKGAARAGSDRSGEAKAARRSGRGASGRRHELNQRVLAELRNLRVQLDQLVERFELRMGAQLNELIARIEGDPSLGQEPRLLTVRTAEAMLDAVAGGEIRPKKARPKDFVRLEGVVRELGDLAPDE